MVLQQSGANVRFRISEQHKPHTILLGLLEGESESEFLLYTELS